MKQAPVEHRSRRPAGEQLPSIAGLLLTTGAPVAEAPE
jgi:hypothetical protein